jgi:hypothetical protein
MDSDMLRQALAVLSMPLSQLIPHNAPFERQGSSKAGKQRSAPAQLVQACGTPCARAVPPCSGTYLEVLLAYRCRLPRQLLKLLPGAQQEALPHQLLACTHARAALGRRQV